MHVSSSSRSGLGTLLRHDRDFARPHSTQGRREHPEPCGLDTVAYSIIFDHAGKKHVPLKVASLGGLAGGIGGSAGRILYIVARNSRL